LEFQALFIKVLPLPCCALHCGEEFQEWWDKSAEAGPQSRPGEQFQEVKPQLEVLAVDSEKNILKFFKCSQEIRKSQWLRW